MSDTTTPTSEGQFSPASPPSHRWTYLIFLLALLTATVFLGNSLNPYSPVKTFIFRIFCLLFAIMWIAELLLPGRKTLARTAADLPLFLFTLWGGLSFLYAESRILTLNSFLHLVCGVFIFFIVSRRVAEKLQARMLLNLLLAAGLAATVFSVFDFLKIDVFPWDALLENRWYSVWKGAKPDLGEALDWDYYFSGRVSSAFGNPVYVAGYLLMLLPVSFSLFLSGRRPGAKLVYALTFIALLLHLTLTFTRFAWLCLPVGLLVVLTVPPRAEAAAALRRNLAWLAAGAVICTLLALPFAFRHPTRPDYFSISERVRSMLNLSDRSLRERALIWKTSWEMAREHLPLGVGLGNFEVFHPPYQSRFFDQKEWLKHTSYPTSAHNEYLEVLCERGIPGLALFAWFLAALLVPAWRARSAGGAEGGIETSPKDDPADPGPLPADPWLAAGVTGGLVALLAYAATQFPLRITPVAVQFWVLAGLLAGFRATRCEAAPSPLLKNIQSNLGPAGRIILLCIFGVLLALLATAVSAPLRANLYALWGTRSLSKGNYQQATRLLNHAANLYPLEQEILHYTAVTWLKLAHETRDPAKRKIMFQNAFMPLRQHFEINPNNPVILNNLGNTFLYLGMPGEAIPVYRKAVKIDPNPANTYYNMGIAYYQKRMYNFSTDAFLRCVELAPGNIQAYYALGNSQSEAGDTKGAEDAYLQALKLNPQNPDTLNHLGQLYDSTGRYGEAVSAYRSAVSIDPAHFAARGNLAISLINTGAFSDAVPILSQLVEEDPGSAIAHFNLGKTLEALGEKEKALGHFHTAAELEPENETYRRHRTSGRQN